MVQQPASASGLPRSLILSHQHTAQAHAGLFILATLDQVVIFLHRSFFTFFSFTK